jgi:hypothetical protein
MKLYPQDRKYCINTIQMNIFVGGERIWTAVGALYGRGSGDRLSPPEALK